MSDLLELSYQELLKDTSGSTVEHLPVLRELASRCDTVVEFGVFMCATSITFLSGCKGEVFSYDVQRTPPVEPLLRLAAGRWVFRQADTLKSVIPECELLFIDSWHTGAQLKAELDMHSHRVKRWIAMHDTETCGVRGEDGQPGLWSTLMDWLDEHPEWRIKEHRMNNNGLTTLERV